MEELDLSRELQSFYEKNRDNQEIRNYDETVKDAKGGFLKIKFSNQEVIDPYSQGSNKTFQFFIENNNLILSVKKGIYCFNTFFLIEGSLLHKNSQWKFLKVNYSNLNSIEKILEHNEENTKREENKLIFKSYKFKGPDSLFLARDGYIKDDRWNKGNIVSKIFSIIEKGFMELKSLELEKERLKEEERVEKLNVSQDNVLSELDKDGNGEVDVVEGNDFSLLLKKHQKSIIVIDRTYVQQFVKVSSYLKTKKNNVQLIFNSIKDTSNEEELNEYVGILKNEIHSYSLILFNSLNMIVSLVADDMITFYGIHESFDKLNIFNSNWENEVSQKLSNIGDGLSNLMYSVEEMGQNIVNEIGHLSYVTEESNQMLSNQLEDIDSSLKTNNFLTGIQTYQMYKINKNTKSLRE
jgi:hypothetical protein